MEETVTASPDAEVAAEVVADIESEMNANTNADGVVVERAATTPNEPPADNEEASAELVAEAEEQEEIERTAVMRSKKEDKVPWPTPLDDNYASLPSNGTKGVSWPELYSSSMKSSLEWLMQNKRILVRSVTWNLCGKPPPSLIDITNKLIPNDRYHLYMIGTEECERTIAQSAFNTSKKSWEAMLCQILGNNYVPLRSHTLQAIHLIAFAHRSILPLISNITSGAVATGLGNTMGNKGGVGVRMNICSSSLLFVNSHLAAHQNAIKLRNSNYQRINKEIPAVLSSSIPAVIKGNLSRNSIIKKRLESKSEPIIPTVGSTEEQNAGAASIATSVNDENSPNNASTTANDEAPAEPKLPSKDSFCTVEEKAVTANSLNTFCTTKGLAGCADHVVFMGDMNYRIRGNRGIVDKLLLMDMHEVLYHNDQLRWSMEHNLVMQGFIEPPLYFRPTYKFDEGTDQYDTGSKKRIPAWTDRILYVPTPNIQCLSYNSDVSLKSSDHRPVYATFMMDLSMDDIDLDCLRQAIVAAEIKSMGKKPKPENLPVASVSITPAATNPVGAAGAVPTEGTATSAVGEKEGSTVTSTVEFTSESQVCSIM